MLVFVPVLLVLSLWFLLGGLLGAPWVPARRRDVENILDGDNVKAGELLIELGCGDGRLLSAAARRGAQCIGYEINPLLWAVSYIRTLRYRKSVKVRLTNFWGRDLSKADIVATFLMPKFMDRLEKKLNKEMPPGSCFMSYVFPLPNTKSKTKKGRWYIYSY